MESNLDTIQVNRKKLKTHVEKVHEDIISKPNECNDYIRTTENLCDQATQTNGDLENKLANVSNEEKKWKDIKRKLATTSHKGMVTLNVGGEKYTTSIDTLAREKDSFFTALFSGRWELERNPNDNSIFIDREGDLFKYILAYLRTDKIHNDVMTNESLRQLLLIEAEYFYLQNLIYILTEPDRKRQQKEEEERLIIEKTFPNGTLLQLEHKAKLYEFFGKSNQKWELIYKATRDGFRANAFHSHCDNKGPTITIIQSNNNYIFGGYTNISWTSSQNRQNDSGAFLFTLTNPHDIPPTKYTIKSDHAATAIYGHYRYGPTFGSSHDIYISHRSNSSNSNHISFPNSYNNTTGKGNNTFTGAKYFTTSEIEVFKLA